MFNAMSMGGGASLGFMTLWGLHMLSVIAFFIGVVFLVILAAKTFNKVQLRNWAIGLMILGTVVCLFTIMAMGHPWIGMQFNGNGMPMMQIR